MKSAQALRHSRIIAGYRTPHFSSAVLVLEMTAGSAPNTTGGELLRSGRVKNTWWIYESHWADLALASTIFNMAPLSGVEGRGVSPCAFALRWYVTGRLGGFLGGGRVADPEVGDQASQCGGAFQGRQGA